MVKVDDAEWDSRKATANLKKHGVDFADAATVLYDDRAITVRDNEAGEVRYVTIGMGRPRTSARCRVHVAREPATLDLSSVGHAARAAGVRG